MEAHIQKWGNSLGIRIPAQFSKQLDLRDGSQVLIEVSDKALIIRAPTYNLDDMLKTITPENTHGLLLEGPATGEEEW